jgi:hypothetical protein
MVFEHLKKLGRKSAKYNKVYWTLAVKYATK